MEGLIIEHGFNQEEEVGKIFSSNNFNQVRCYKDLNGLPRFTTGLKIKRIEDLYRLDIQ